MAATQTVQLIHRRHRDCDVIFINCDYNTVMDEFVRGLPGRSADRHPESVGRDTAAGDRGTGRAVRRAGGPERFRSRSHRLVRLPRGVASGAGGTPRAGCG